MAKSALFTVHKNEPCPQCGAELVIRSGKHGPFLGCSHYPECDYVRPRKISVDGCNRILDSVNNRETDRVSRNE